MKLTPKQKTALNRPRPFLSLIVLTLLGAPWLLLFWIGDRARWQQPNMDTRADTFFAQFPMQRSNTAAKQFDRLGAKLGFPPNDASSLDLPIDRQAKEDFQTIDDALGSFLSAQVAKTTGPLDAIPPALLAYLSTYRASLEEVHIQLLQEDAPQWEMDVDRMSNLNYPSPGFVNAYYMQQLLLIAAIDSSQRGQVEQMEANLEASWRLNQAIARRPDLVSQTLISVVSEQQAGLLRHLQQVPDVWRSRLFQQSEQQSVIDGVIFETWLQYQIAQRALGPATAATASPATASPLEHREIEHRENFSQRILAALSHWFSPQAYFRLTVIDVARTAHLSTGQVKGLNVCSTTQREAEQIAAQIKTARWNRATIIAPDILAARWKRQGDRALQLELTQKVLLAKQLAKSNQQPGQWPDRLPDLSSQACPGEHWVYERHPDNTIALSLSKPVASHLGLSLRYRTRN